MPELDVPHVITRDKLGGADGVCLTTNIVGRPVEEVERDDEVNMSFEGQEGIWFSLFDKAGRIMADWETRISGICLSDAGVRSTRSSSPRAGRSSVPVLPSAQREDPRRLYWR